VTSIVAVATYLPERSVPIAEHLADIGVDENPDVYQRYYGFGRIRRDPAGNLAEQMCAAVSKLDVIRGRERDIRYVVHAPTIQLSAPFPVNVLHTVCLAQGLRWALPFSLTQQACASALLAIDACGKLLASDSDPDALALILTGEKTFTRVAQVITHSAIMGEGVAAVLVRAGGERDRMLAYATRTLGEYYEAPDLSPELEASFQGIYTGTLVEVIKTALARADLSPDDVALVLPHNVNRLSWLRVLLAAGIPKDRLFLDHQAEFGHCFGADPFISLQAVSRSGRLRRGDHYVMTAAGLGATLAAMVFRH
jgi:3-oxoacyl-[acyl-carrier-protein] synthase-3